jgi:molybdenum cofactor cytidylyltransferase
MVALSADLVVLAAGRSSRMGTAKGLVQVRGRPWLELQLEAAHVAGLPRAIVVLNRDSEPLYRATLDSLKHAEVVINEDPDRGPFSSLLCGLGAVAARSPGAPAFVLPVDVPAARPEVWSALAAAMTDGIDAAVPTLSGRGGHPVLLGPAFVAHLLSLPADAARTARLDHVLRLRRVASVPVDDENVRLNLNTPSDWVIASADGTRPRHR